MPTKSNTAPAPAKRRRRATAKATAAPSVSQGTDPVTEEFRASVVEALAANKAKNAAFRGEAKSRKTLEGLLEREGIDSFGFWDPKMGKVRVAMETPVSDVCSIDTLRDAVSEEVFMRIVSATKAAVVRFAGEATFHRCAVPQKGNPTLKIKTSAK